MKNEIHVLRDQFAEMASSSAHLLKEVWFTTSHSLNLAILVCVDLS
jgi:hypothetical protein